MNSEASFYYNNEERLKTLSDIINDNTILKDLQLNLNDETPEDYTANIKYNKFKEKLKDTRYNDVKIYKRNQYYNLVTFINLVFTQILQDLNKHEHLNTFYNYEDAELHIMDIDIHCYNVPDNMNKKEPTLLTLRSNTHCSNKKVNMMYLFRDIFRILRERYNIEGLILELGTISY